jgi:hypothetical protein
MLLLTRISPQTAYSIFTGLVCPNLNIRQQEKQMPITNVSSGLPIFILKLISAAHLLPFGAL